MVLVLTVAFLVAGLTAWLPARLSVVAENSSRMSRPNTVTTPMAAMAIKATMIRYSDMPWPACDLSILRRKRRAIIWAPSRGVGGKGPATEERVPDPPAGNLSVEDPTPRRGA